jgi:ATP-dependent Clp protease adaptor protein ClpS
MSLPVLPGEPRWDEESDVATENVEKVETPRLWRVLLHNDDYTTMDFVIMILEKIFLLGPVESYSIMMNVHRKGIGVAGIFPREVAETKVAKATDLARANEFPLLVTMEPDE